MSDQILDIDRLRNLVEARFEVQGPGRAILLGIDGRGGSGKSTLARRLERDWPDTQVVEIDDFYLPKSQRPDDPAILGGNFDLSRLESQVLSPVSTGIEARYQRYDWNDDRLAEWQKVTASRFVIVEGIYSTLGPLRSFYDFTIWVEAPYEVRLSRGIARDGEQMRSTWVDQWMPAEDRYVSAEQPAKHADLTVSGDGDDGTVEFHILPTASGAS